MLPIAQCFAAGTTAAVRGDGPQPPAVLGILESAMVLHDVIQLLPTPASKTGVAGCCGFEACKALGQHRCGVVQRRRDAHGYASPNRLWRGASAAPAAGAPGGSRKTGFEAALLLMPRSANSAMAKHWRNTSGGASGGCQGAKQQDPALEASVCRCCFQGDGATLPARPFLLRQCLASTQTAQRVS